MRNLICVLIVVGASGCGGSTESTASGGAAGSGGGSAATGGGGTGATAGSGGSGATAGGGGTGAVAGGGGSGGSAKNSGECDSDADCAPGTCVELSPGGYRVCKLPVEEATQCIASGIDECCNSSECTTGKCLEFPTQPYCGGAMPQPHNVCASDLCQSAAECSTDGKSLCVPAGALGFETSGSVGTSCLKDTDCMAAAGGACVMLRDPCCGSPSGLVCSYPGGCKSQSDCPNGYCAVVNDPTTGTPMAKCQSGPIACPA